MSSQGQIHGGVFTAMSDRDRNDQHTNWLLIACIILLAAAWSVAVWGISAQNAYQIAKGDNRAEHYYGDTYDPECSRVPLLFDDCSPGYVDTEQERQTAEYDLAAQNRMADWTAILVLVSIFGTVLSVVGVCLIYSTFQETKRTTGAAFDAAKAAQDANHIAKEIADLEIRPWVSIDVIPTSIEIDGGEMEIRIGLDIRFQNHGQSVANRIVASYEINFEHAHCVLPARHNDGSVLPPAFSGSIMPGETLSIPVLEKSHFRSGSPWANGIDHRGPTLQPTVKIDLTYCTKTTLGEPDARTTRVFRIVPRATPKYTSYFMRSDLPRAEEGMVAVVTAESATA